MSSVKSNVERFGFSSSTWRALHQRSHSIWYFSTLSRKSFLSFFPIMPLARKYVSRRVRSITFSHQRSANSHAGSASRDHSQSITQTIFSSCTLILLGLIVSPWISEVSRFSGSESISFMIFLLESWGRLSCSHQFLDSLSRKYFQDGDFPIRKPPPIFSMYPLPEAFLWWSSDRNRRSCSKYLWVFQTENSSEIIPSRTERIQAFSPGI